MATEQSQLEAAIAALEAQRAALGDAVVDSLLAPARARLAALVAPAAAPAEPAQALKQVTILFLDVVGSTTLSQHLDPESISAVMDDALARGTELVLAQQGKVLQYAGDNILAAFGAEIAREDDAERAVHCGLALLDLGRQLGAEVLAAHGHAGFNVRVGLHTGGVLLGGGVDAEGTIRGIAVNIAARMEQTAPPGALRISHDTYAQVRGVFEVDPQEPLAVKGVDVPVRSYLVLRAKPRPFRIRTRGIEGVATRMVGRRAELQALQTAFERLFTEQRLAAVTVVAEAGIGKSRLLYEFEAWSEARTERFFLFRGRATPQTDAQAFGLLRDILAWRFQIADEDDLDTARRKLQDGIVPLFEPDQGADVAEGHAHLLGHLIGIDWKDSRHVRGILDDPQQIRNRGFHAAAQVIRRIGAGDGTPVVLQLEDLHWADRESLDFLVHLCRVNRDVPLLLLAFTRPTLFERRSDWGRPEEVHTRIDLAPLGAEDSRALAEELLQKLPAIPDAMHALLTTRAEGNPFYMEELVKVLIDQGAIRSRAEAETDDAWSVDVERLRLARVPPTLTGVLQARLDALPADERRALQAASIVGAAFWDQALAAVEAAAADKLAALTQRALTLPRADAPTDGPREYAFHHQLLHQVTYDTVLRRAKRVGHERVAQWMARLAEAGSSRAGDFLGLAAAHFEWAGDEAHAAEFHARAAEHAGQRLAHERVLDHVGRGLALIGPSTADPGLLKWRLLSARERTLGVLARRDEQGADLQALAELAEAMGDEQRRADVALRSSIRFMRMADRAACLAEALKAEAWATRAGDDHLRLMAVRLRASVLTWQGEVEPGKALARQALDEARRLGLRACEAQLTNTLAIAAEMQGDLVGGLDLYRQCVQAHRANGARLNEAIGLLNLGVGWMGLGDLDQARVDLDAALQMLHANGDRSMEGVALSQLSALACWQGDAARAFELASAALERAQASQAPDYEVLAGMRLGDAALALGRNDTARQAHARARQRALEVNARWQHDASAGLARVALAEGDAAEALATLQPVLAHVAAGGSLGTCGEPRQVELTCHLALARSADPRAREWIERAHDALMTQAQALNDAALRERYLTRVPSHRDIVAAWARH